MKKYFIIMAATCLLCVGCKDKNQSPAPIDIDPFSFSHADSTWYDELKYSDCLNSDILLPTKQQADNPLTAKLVDAYNCAVVSRSVYTDMEKVWRFYSYGELTVDHELLDGFRSLDCSSIKNDTMRALSDSLINIAVLAA